MNTTASRFGLVALLALAMLAPGVARAQDAEQAARLYSRGVHAYFDGRMRDAEGLLSRSIELGSRDPRSYYFRGLSQLRLGRDGEARADLATGARLEAARTNRFAVGASLMRVQGGDRLLLEQYRLEARANASSVAEQVARQRARQMAARDEGALRQKVVIPLDALLEPGNPRALTPEEVARRAAMMRRGALPPQASTAATPEAPDANPFRDDPEGAEPESATPRESTPPPAAPAESADDDNPFGDF